MKKINILRTPIKKDCTSYRTLSRLIVLGGKARAGELYECNPDSDSDNGHTLTYLTRKGLIRHLDRGLYEITPNGVLAKVAVDIR